MGKDSKPAEYKPLYAAGLDESADTFKLPRLPVGTRRKLYVQSITDAHKAVLISKGYVPIDVRTMPRNTPTEIHESIFASLQGMTDGTLPFDAERRQAVELEAKAHGLLINKSQRVEVKATVGEESIEALLATRPTPRLARRISVERQRLAEEAGIHPEVKVGLGSFLKRAEEAEAPVKPEEVH